jgi:alkylhydroperoxidase family enzyme
MEAFIKPPKNIPFYIGIGIKIAKKITGKDLLVPKILSWYPKCAISSGMMEAMVAHGRKDLDKRILKLVRIQASLCVSCPFCIDMNSFEYKKLGISKETVYMLQHSVDIKEIKSLSKREQLAIEYTKQISQTPIKVLPELVNQMKMHFTEREIVILASTVAQVNYWARLIQGLGIPPAGFSSECTINKR